jgi:hypothetical protein
MTKEILIQQLTNNKWEIIDSFMNISNENFNAIGEIYHNTSKEISQSSVSWFKSFIFHGINLTILVYNNYTIAQLQMILQDKDFAKVQALRSNRSTDSLYQITKKLLSFLRFIPTLNMFQLMYLLKNYLYKGQEFNDLFISKVADYILLEISLNNVPPQFITFIESLCLL